MLHSAIFIPYWRVTDGQTDTQMDGRTLGHSIAQCICVMRQIICAWTLIIVSQ